MSRKELVLSIVVVCSVLLLALGCQAAQPVPLGTPKPAEKAVATATKPAEKAAATSAKPVEKPVRGGTLREVVAGDPPSMDPHTDANAPQHRVTESLLWLDPDMNLTKKGLVKDWTASADGKSIILKLREGVKFHDGTDLDAAAVKFNIERIKDPATKSVYRSDYAKVDSMEVVDGLTVRLNLKQPDPILLDIMGFNPARIVSPAAVKKYGQDFGRNPVGAGPFRFVEWVPGDHITYKRYEGYYRKDQDGNQTPYLEQIVVRIVPDETTAFASLRTGQADFLANLSAVPLPTLKGDPNLTYSIRKSTVPYGIYLNTVRPPFDNKALRQAVALAVDRQGIVDRKGEGASALASVLHPISWAYDEKVGQFPARDLAKAKAKMAEAGYAGGLKLKMPSLAIAEDLLDAQVLKANLAEISLQVEIESLSNLSLFAKVRTEGNYQIAAMLPLGQGLADPGYILNQNLHSQGGRNFYGPYGNPQVDQLLDKAGSIYDQKERTALYREAATILADDAPFIPIYVFMKINGMSKKVRNFVQYTDNYPRFHDVWLAP